MAKPSLHARSIFRSSYYEANRRTLWAACRAVIFGCVVIAVGLAMTVLGYFDKQFSERMEVVDGTIMVYHDLVIQYQLKSMQYLGPILMGIGAFILIIACVVTLESRDKHAQLITEESMYSQTKDPISIEERAELTVDEESPDEESERLLNVQNNTGIDKHSVSTWVEVHRPSNDMALPLSHTQAPLADIDSLDLHSSSSQILTDQRETDAINSGTQGMQQKE